LLIGKEKEQSAFKALQYLAITWLSSQNFPTYQVYLLVVKVKCNNQVAEDEIGGPCSTDGGEEELL
jgi:hypothetical protein